MHRHRRQLTCLAARDDDVARRCPRLAAVEAVGRVVAAIGAERQRRLRREQLVLAHVREPAALAARAARVGYDPVALDSQRQVGLDQLDRLVAEVGEWVRDALEAVEARARAPAADEHLGGAERPAVLVVASPGNQRRPALARGDHPVGHDRRERSHDRVVDAVADHAAGAARGRQHRIDDRAARGVDPDRDHVALAVRDLAPDDAANGAVGRREHHPDGAVHARLDLGRGAVEVDQHLVTGDLDAHADRDRHGLVADAVDVVREGVDAVRELRQLGPHHPLGDALQLVHVLVRVGAVALDQGRQPALADPAGRELRP